MGKLNFICKKCGSSNVKIDKTYPFHDIYECSDCLHNSYARTEDCCRTPYLIVAILHYDHDRYVLYHQCLHCGGANKMRHLKSKGFGEHINRKFNEDQFQQWKSERSEEGTMIYEALKQANYRNTNAYKYHNYLRSPEWRDRRKKVLDRDGNLCQRCKIEPALDVHHITYCNLFNEPLEDLQSLCRNCHSTLHRNEFIQMITKQLGIPLQTTPPFR